MVDVLNTGTWSPAQALLEAQSVEDMEHVVIAYLIKGEDAPRLTCSSMKPDKIHFLGSCVQHYALGQLTE